jgi:hypothetical protein
VQRVEQLHPKAYNTKTLNLKTFASRRQEQFYKSYKVNDSRMVLTTSHVHDQRPLLIGPQIDLQKIHERSLWDAQCPLQLWC